MSFVLRFAAPLAVLALAACQDGGSVTAQRGSPAGVPVALESIDGVPTGVKTAFTSELAAAASSREVDLADSSSTARYRVRGYVSREVGSDGAPAMAFVWDVYDVQNRRARRLTGSSPMRGSSDASALDKETLAKLAAMSMDEIATFLAEARMEPQPTQTADASLGASIAR